MKLVAALALALTFALPARADMPAVVLEAAASDKPVFIGVMRSEFTCRAAAIALQGEFEAGLQKSAPVVCHTRKERVLPEADRLDTLWIHEGDRSQYYGHIDSEKCEGIAAMLRDSYNRIGGAGRFRFECRTVANS
jgi:hypothetical protein